MNGVYCQICWVFIEFSEDIEDGEDIEFLLNLHLQTTTKFVKDCKYIFSFSFSFVFGCTVKGNEVKHLPHTGADTVAVITFKLGG